MNKPVINHEQAMDGCLKTFIWIALFVSVFILVSCNPCKRLAKKCPPQTIIEKHDSIIYITDTVIKDSIIEVILPKDTVRITKYLNVPANVLLSLDTIIVERGIVGAKAWIEENELGIVAYVTDSSLFYKLDSARITINTLKEKYQTNNTTETIHIRSNTAFASFTIWFFWIVIAFTVGYLYYKFKIKRTWNI